MYAPPATEVAQVPKTSLFKEKVMPHKANGWKSLQLVPVLAALLLVGGAARTRSCNNCEQRIQRAEGNLHKAIRRHGDRSRQAERRRRELEQARRSCRDGNRDRR
jgi:hypothetical protein